MNQSTVSVLVNHTQAEMYLTNMAESASILAGCSQEVALKMLEVLELAQIKLSLLMAIEDAITFAGFDNSLDGEGL